MLTKHKKKKASKRKIEVKKKLQKRLDRLRSLDKIKKETARLEMEARKILNRDSRLKKVVEEIKEKQLTAEKSEL